MGIMSGMNESIMARREDRSDRQEEK